MAISTRNPRHVAIIMDGNGRWAKRKGYPRRYGHEQGAKTLMRLVEEMLKLGIPYLSVFAFSILNWKRSPAEVRAIWNLLTRFLEKERQRLMDSGIRLVVIGQRSGIPERVLRQIESVEKETQLNVSLTLVVALNYDGEDEIARAVTKMLRQEVRPSEVTPELIRGYLDAPGIPNPDIVIRTGVENSEGPVFRLSGFLLLQSAQAVLVPLSVLWPDFHFAHLMHAVLRWRDEDHLNGGQRPEAATVAA